MEEFDNLKVGDITDAGVITRIFSKNIGGFIIYEVNNSGRLTYDSVGDIGKHLSSIEIELTDVNNLLSTSRERSRFIVAISGAVRECFLGKTDAAKKKLISIKNAIVDYKTTIGRIEYFFGTLGAAIIAITSLLIVSLFTLNDHLIILKIIFMGVLGGVLSVAINLKSIAINTISGNREIHLILGATRIIISSISSIIVYVLIKGGFLLGIIHQQGEYVFYALGAVSGFSEAFIPNLLKKVDNNKTENAYELTE